MKAERHTKQLTMLDGDEASLRDRLIALLLGVATGGAQLFLNSMNSPEEAARYSHQEADELFKTARRCLELRGNLAVIIEGYVADHFLIACHEAASGDEHRGGPRKLAKWLVTKLSS